MPAGFGLAAGTPPYVAQEPRAMIAADLDEVSFNISIISLLPILP